MDDFKEKWQSDEKFRATIKLLGYIIFIILVALYSFSLNTKYGNKEEPTKKEKVETTKDILKIPKKYNYIITIEINDNKYEYNGQKTTDKEIIQKKVADKTTNYVYLNDEYYVEDATKIDNYIKTTKDEVYDIINYDYISFDTIKEYLKKATKEEDEYHVYLKDIILTNTSDKYFIININEDNINIDYTNLMKEFNSEIQKYIVNIEIKDIDKIEEE